MIVTTSERKSLLPEIRVVGKRFVIEEKEGSPSAEVQATPTLFDGGAREVTDPVVKTGLIPKHVWG